MKKELEVYIIVAIITIIFAITITISTKTIV